MKSKSKSIGDLNDGTLFRIFSFLTKKDLAKISPSNKRFNRIANDPLLWDTIEGNLSQNWEYSSTQLSTDSQIRAITSRSGGELAVGYANNIIDLISINDSHWKTKKRIFGPSDIGLIANLTFDPEGNLIARFDGGACVYNNQGHQLYQIKMWNALKVLPNGDIVKIYQGGGLTSVRSKKDKYDIDTSTQIDAVTSDNNNNIVTGLFNGRIQVWQSENHECILDIHIIKSPVIALAILPNNDIVSSHDNKCVYIWNHLTGKIKIKLSSNVAWVRHLITLNNGSIVTCSYTEIKVFNNETGELQMKFRHEGNVFAQYVAPYENDIVLFGMNNSINIIKNPTSVSYQNTKAEEEQLENKSNLHRVCNIL